MKSPRISLISIYANLDKKINLIGPYIVVGCFLDQEYEYDLKGILYKSKYKTPLQTIKLINNLKIPKDKLFVYPFILESYFIDLYGVDIAIKKAIKYIESVFNFKMHDESLVIENPFYVLQTSRLISIEGTDSVYLPLYINRTSLSIAKLYTEALRDYYLGFYFRKYPKLWINVHKGRTTPHHFSMLKSCSLLPECYIKHLTAQFFIDSLTKSKGKNFTLPFWLKNWIDYYSF